MAEQKSPKSNINDTTLDQPDPKVALVLDQYLEDLQNGRACGREELLKRHPDLKEELIEYLNGIEMVAGLGVGNELVPQRLGDFEIVKPIGRGAMGVVYLANQISLKRQVALKVLRYSVSGQQATKRFEREAELAATLKHPNIVPIYATGEHDNSHFLAMQLIDGPSLAQWSVDENSQRAPKTIARWGAQVARALTHAHQCDVIHRDVKPSNLLKDNDHIWLTDFGLARRFDDLRMSMTGAMLGTPNYMSPEQASPTRYPIDYRTDIYSLGATLFELLTGRCVFLAETPHAVLAQVITEEPQPLREILPDASRDLETILLKCLEKEPAERYQTAEQLAEDLEAFAEDRSIKARRPSLIERATRWKRKNQKVVSSALLAVTVAVMFVAISLAFWVAWNNSITGTIEIASSEGPIVGRLIDDEGTASPTFSIPTDRPLPATAGEHTLQLWSGGRIGENQQITVAAGKSTELDVKLSNQGVFDERTVQGIPKVLSLGDRDDLLFFHKDGITRMDGRSGQELWTAKADSFIEAINESAAKELPSKANKDAEKLLARSIDWNFNRALFFDYDDAQDPFNLSLPTIAKGFPDVNADGQPDIMIACDHHPALIVFDGQTGDLLWHYNAGSSSKNHLSKTLHAPTPLGDIDGDSVPDFSCMFYSKPKTGRPKKSKRWIDAVSGKTGKRIWRNQIPAMRYKTPQSRTFSQLCQLKSQDSYFRELYATLKTHGDQWAYRARKFENFGSPGEPLPWAVNRVPDLTSEASEHLLFTYEDKLHSCNLKTGKAGSFNDGQALELGFIPVIQPRWVQTFGDDRQTLGLLLAEILPNPQWRSTRNRPVTRFSLRSAANGEELWRFDAQCDPEWVGKQPAWPLIADLNGDSNPEILIVDGADIPFGAGEGQPCCMQVLDGRTGKPLWDQQDCARIRSHDSQIQHVLIGSDEDGDGVKDVVVVSPMAKIGSSSAKSEAWVFIDVLSGASGKRIRTVGNKIPVCNVGRTGLAFYQPFFLGPPSDRRIVISSKATDGNSQRQSTVVISTANGELLNVCDQLEHPILADGDGDGTDDLFLLKPRDRSKIYASSQLVSLKSTGGRIKLTGDGQFSRIEDVDDDGIRDLLDAPISSHILGLDRENVRVRRVISGASGKYLRQQELTGEGGNSRAKHRDLNQDGQRERLLFHHFGDFGAPESRTRLTCFDGKSGDEIWHFDVAQNPSANSNARLSTQGPFYETRILDINGDRTLDIICPYNHSEFKRTYVAIDGKNGQVIWKLPLPSNAPYFEIIPSSGKKQPVLVTAWKGKNRSRKAPLTVGFFDIRSGTQVSTWTGNQEFPRDNFRFGATPREHGEPFTILAGDKQLAGLILEADIGNQLVVLDFDSKLATEVQRISNAKWDRAWKLIVVDDLNDDGNTDGVLFTGKQLIAMDLISGKEITRRSFAFSQEAFLTSERKWIGVKTKDGDNQRLKLVDPRTLEVKWDIDWPRDKQCAHLLCEGDLSAPKHATLPRVLFTNHGGNQSAIVATASLADIRDNHDLFANLARSSDPLGANIKYTTFDDPRMLQPLPWNYETPMNSLEIRGLDHSPIVLVTQLFPIVLGAIVFPAWLVTTMIRRRRWSLQWLLLLPLAFALPYILLTIPSPLRTEFSDPYSLPLWCRRAFSAITLLPFLIFIGVFAMHCFKQHWKTVLLLMFFVVAAPVLPIGLDLIFNSESLPEGYRYDWLDPRSLWLLWLGVWMVGLGIAIKRVLFSFGRLLWAAIGRLGARRKVVAG